MSGWRKRQVVEMAREAGAVFPADGSYHKFERHEDLEAFAALVRADEAEKYKWDVHSCGPTCAKVSCVAMRKAVEAEREACAMVCDHMAVRYEDMRGAALESAAESIRLRGQA
jgi:uncharacterized protein (UPF0216 family)